MHMRGKDQQIEAEFGREQPSRLRSSEALRPIPWSSRRSASDQVEPGLDLAERVGIGTRSPGRNGR